MVKSKSRKYPKLRAREIPLSEVEEFLEGKGFTVEKLDRPWRHVVGIIRKVDAKYFFKLGTTLKVSKMTENEYLWYELVGEHLNSDTPFVVPKGLEKGLYNERLFYHISDYFEGETLADKYPPTTKSLASWIQKIARAVLFIGSIPLPEQYKSPRKLPGERLFESASEWGSQLSSDVSSLLDLIESSKDRIEVSLNHGDFVPWHMYNLGSGKFGLVDAEHGGPKPKYYDVAYFYTRIRQSLGEKELARKFLLEIQDLFPKNVQETFWRDLKPVLAQRLVGNYWEIEIGHDIGRDIGIQRCEDFKNDLVSNKII